MYSSPMITILTGGHSSEREVSFSTSRTIEKSLKKLGHTYMRIDIADPDWLEQIIKTPPDICIIAAHGRFAEDGSLQRILENNKISFTGSSSVVSSRCFNKAETKQVAKHSCQIKSPKEFKLKESQANLPVVIKPNQEGSSFGISIVDSKDKIGKAYKYAAKYDKEVLIEEYIVGRELTCGVIDVFGKIDVLPIVEIKPKNRFFDYESKYIPGMATETCPADIDKKIKVDVQEKSICLFNKFNIRQYCRIDWILRRGELFLIEINTLPGMTPTSLINKEIVAAGIGVDNFVNQLIKS